MYPQNNCLFFYQTCIFHHGCRKFSNLLCSDYLKVHFQFKQIESRYLIMFPYAKFPPGSYRHCPSREKIPFTQRGNVFPKICLPQQKGWGRKPWCTLRSLEIIFNFLVDHLLVNLLPNFFIISKIFIIFRNKQK